MVKQLLADWLAHMLPIDWYTDTFIVHGFHYILILVYTSCMQQQSIPLFNNYDKEKFCSLKVQPNGYYHSMLLGRNCMGGLCLMVESTVCDHHRCQLSQHNAQILNHHHPAQWYHRVAQLCLLMHAAYWQYHAPAGYPCHIGNSTILLWPKQLQVTNSTVT